MIFNPAAGNRRAGKAFEDVRDALARSEIDFELVLTNAPREAIRLAGEMAADFDLIVAAGGDGTIQEVVHGILESRTSTPLGIIPLGTGNDLAKLIGMSLKPEEAIRQLQEADIIPYDTGYVRWRNHGSGEWNHAPFINAVGIGFDAVVASESKRYKRVGGMLSYFLGIFRALALWPRPDVRVERLGESLRLMYGGVTEPADSSILMHEGRLFMAAVGNGRTIGGGFNINPYASPIDGLLDLCFVENVTYPRLPILIPQVVRGTHLKAPEVLSERLTSLRIVSEKIGIPLHFDGEVLTTEAAEIEVSVRPRSIHVVCPEHSFALGAS